jgi:hypothetical protein
MARNAGVINTASPKYLNWMARIFDMTSIAPSSSG